MEAAESVTNAKLEFEMNTDGIDVNDKELILIGALAAAVLIE